MMHDAGGTVVAATSNTDRALHGPRNGNRGRLMRVLAVSSALALVSVTTFGLLTATDAVAEELLPVPEVGTPGQLTLSSSVYPLVFPALEPGESFSWQIGVTVDAASATPSSLQLAASGTLAANGGYRITVHDCDTLWAGTSGRNQTLTCATGAVSIVDEQAISTLDQTRLLALGSPSQGNPRFLGLQLTRGAASDDFPAEPFLSLGLGITSISSDDVPQDPAGPGSPTVPAVPPRPAGPGVTDLPTTGSATSPQLWGAAGLLLLGTSLVLARRRKGTTS